MSDLTVGEVMRRAAALHGRKNVKYKTEAQRLAARRKAAREYQKRVRGEAVVVHCPECKTPRLVQERQARRIASGVHSGLCLDCRYPRRSFDAQESYEQFWRSRFTQQEIDDLWAAVSLYLEVPDRQEAAA